METEKKTTQQREKKAEKKPAPKRIARTKQTHHDHVPIILCLVVIFGFALLCIGIGLTRF